MLPPDERLDLGDRLVGEIDHRLEEDPQLVPLERQPELLRPLQLGQVPGPDPRVEDGVAVAADLLRLVHGGVGVAQEAVGRRLTVVGLGHGDADAGRRLDLMPVDEDRLGHRAEQPLGDLDRPLRGGEVLAHDHELVAAVPGDRVGGAQQRAEAGGDAQEQLVASGVAEGVVHRLEAVEVDEQDSHERVDAVLLQQGLLEPVEQQRPVGEPGEGVAQGQLGEGLLPDPDRLGQLPLVGDVAGQDDLRPATAEGEGRAADFDVDQRPVLLPVEPRRHRRSARRPGLIGRLQHPGDVLDRPDVGDRHPEELFPGVAVVVQGGVIDGQESQGVAVVHPHRRRVGVEQQAVARPEIRVVAGVQVQVGDAGQRAGVCVLHRRFPLEGVKAHVLSQKEAPGRSPARWLSGQPAGRGEARSFASPGFPGFAVSSGWLCCV